MALAERDVRHALGIVEAAAATQNGSPFGTELLDAMLGAIPAFNVEYGEWWFREPPTVLVCRPSDLWVGLGELAMREPEVLTTDPLWSVRRATSIEPLRISDVVSVRAFRQTAFYSVFMRPYGVEHALTLWLPAPSGQARCFAFVRGPGKDFGNRDVAMLRLLRPYLARLRARWERAPRPAQLTERERDVLELVAQGLTNRDVARQLFISPLTVRKHLEHVYEKLGVRTRAGAVAAAFRAAS
jgi:DNA-binding CsgD family transcriptional regulator